MTKQYRVTNPTEQTVYFAWTPINVNAAGFLTATPGMDIAGFITTGGESPHTRQGWTRKAIMGYAGSVDNEVFSERVSSVLQNPFAVAYVDACRTYLDAAGLQIEEIQTGTAYTVTDRIALVKKNTPGSVQLNGLFLEEGDCAILPERTWPEFSYYENLALTTSSEFYPSGAAENSLDVTLHFV